MALIPAYRTGPMASQELGDTKLKELKPTFRLGPPVPKSVLLVTPKSSHAFQEYSFPDSEAFEDTKPRKQTLSFRLGPPVPKSILRSKDSHALEGFPFSLAPVPKSKPLSFLGFAPEMRTKRPPTDEPDNARATKTAKSE